MLHQDELGKYFSHMSGTGPGDVQRLVHCDFQVRNIAAKVGNPAKYLASSLEWGTDRHTKEDTTSAVRPVQPRLGNLGIPMNLSAGLRYEKTDVTVKAAGADAARARAGARRTSFA